MDAVEERTAIVLVAHGERRATATNGALLAHAAEIAVRMPRAAVEAAVLYGEPSLERVLRALPEEREQVLVYPFFMAEGYIVSHVLPRRIGAMAAARRVTVLQPLGLDHRLPSLLLRASLRTGQAAGFDPSGTRLLIVGHGSRLARGSASVARMADNLRSRRIFATVETAFIEHPPLVCHALRQGGPQTVVAGLFSGEGLHARQDLPAALKAAATSAAYTGPIGVHPEIPDLVARAVAEKLASLCGRGAVPSTSRPSAGALGKAWLHSAR